MTSEQDIRQRVANAKQRWDDARKEYAKPLSLKLSPAAAAYDMMDSAIAYTAALEAALAAVSSERDAALAALEPFASVAHRFAVLPDEIQIWTLYPSLRVFHFRDAVRIVRGLEQAARQHDDAAEGSG